MKTNLHLANREMKLIKIEARKDTETEKKIQCILISCTVHVSSKISNIYYTVRIFSMCNSFQGIGYRYFGYAISKR